MFSPLILYQQNPISAFSSIFPTICSYLGHLLCPSWIFASSFNAVRIFFLVLLTLLKVASLGRQLQVSKNNWLKRHLSELLCNALKHRKWIIQQAKLYKYQEPFQIVWASWVVICILGYLGLSWALTFLMILCTIEEQNDFQ